MKSNPNIPDKPHIIELGSTGIEQYDGFIHEAYNEKLTWPNCQSLYDKIRRSDPEIAIVRNLYFSLSRNVHFSMNLDIEDPNDDEKRAVDFGYQVIDDMMGGENQLLETAMNYVPFMGWGWWEVLHGVRSPEFSAPEDDGWRSKYSDNLVGVRRLAWRDSSTFAHWDMAKNGRLLGLAQYDISNQESTEEIMIPLEKSLHMTYGDSINPEGLSPLEAVWRLQRIKYGLEIILGIGFEHAAGYIDVTCENTPNDQDKAFIKQAAKNIMTAQAGNYAVWPKGIAGEIKDITFSAGSELLNTIKYYGLMKLTIYNTQWVALSTITGSGSYAAMDDSSSMFLVTYNAMLDGFAKQFNDQVGRRLYNLNKGAFPKMRVYPEFHISHIDKNLALAELNTFMGNVNDWMVLDDEDILAIRKASKVLPVKIPDEESKAVKTTSRDNTALRQNFAVQRYMNKLRETNPVEYEKLANSIAGRGAA